MSQLRNMITEHNKMETKEELMEHGWWKISIL